MGAMARILVVDDDDAIRLLYRLELEEEGYTIETSDDCCSLLERIEYSRPNLILLDVRLVEINGIDILQEIRDRYDHLPVILCSAYPFFQYDRQELVADYYITKSGDLRELKHTIKMALEKTSHEMEVFLPSVWLDRPKSFLTPDVVKSF